MISRSIFILFVALLFIYFTATSWQPPPPDIAWPWLRYSVLIHKTNVMERDYDISNLFYLENAVVGLKRVEIDPRGYHLKSLSLHCGRWSKIVSYAAKSGDDCKIGWQPYCHWLRPRSMPRREDNVNPFNDFLIPVYNVKIKIPDRRVSKTVFNLNGFVVLIFVPLNLGQTPLITAAASRH